ncbi:MAG: hypothetical protein WBG66_16110, partial [Geitlerinemataceae cyanobacterium]
MPRMSIFAKLSRAADRFSDLPKTFRLVWEAAAPWTSAWLILLIIQGFLPVATVYLTRTVVDSLTAVMGAGVSAQSIQTLLIPAGLMAGVLVLGEVLQGLGEWIRTAQSELVQDHISGLVHAKSVSVDYGFYESSDCYDRLDRARSGAGGRSLALLQSSGSLLQNSITL